LQTGIIKWKRRFSRFINTETYSIVNLVSKQMSHWLIYFYHSMLFLLNRLPPPFWCGFVDAGRLQIVQQGLGPTRLCLCRASQLSLVIVVQKDLIAVVGPLQVLGRVFHRSAQHNTIHFFSLYFNISAVATDGSLMMNCRVTKCRNFRIGSKG